MRRLSTLALALLLVAGCAVRPARVRRPPAGFSLRAWVTQAIEPVAAFGMGGSSVAIADGRAILYGPMPAIVHPHRSCRIQRASISQHGIDGDRRGGAGRPACLSGSTDFTAGGMPGSRTARSSSSSTASTARSTGDPDRQIVCVTTPCEAPPGTPEAFGWFWACCRTCRDGSPTSSARRRRTSRSAWRSC